MKPQELQKTVGNLIQLGRYADVPLLIEQAATGLNNAEKERLIPFVEDTGLECYFDRAGFFAAGECYRLAADLAAVVHGDGDARSIQKLRRAPNHFAGPDYRLTAKQKRDSAAKSVFLSKRLSAVLEQHHPDDLEARADCAVLEIFSSDWNEPLTIYEYQQHKALYERSLELTSKPTDRNPSNLQVIGTCLHQNNGRIRDAQQLPQAVLQPDGESWRKKNPVPRFPASVCDAVETTGMGVAQELLGHSDPRITLEICQHNESDEMRQAVNRLFPGLGKVLDERKSCQRTVNIGKLSVVK